MDHLPPVVRSIDIVGRLTARAASELGLVEGIPVFGGGGDASLIPLGAGCTELYDAHIYVGTSGWVEANVNVRKVDIPTFTGSILGAIPGEYVYIAEQETSGVCLQWVRDHLALDEIGMYLDAHNVCESDKSAEYATLYDFLNKVIEETPAGCGGLVFTPWLHGNRSPAEDPYARGMFFNIGLGTGKRQMIRAVVEGVCFHTRWMLEALEKNVPHRPVLRFVGGGALSDVWCQIMADVTGRRIEVVEDAQNAGAAGAAIVCGVGLGLIKSFREAKALVPVRKTYEPRPDLKPVYDLNYSVFKDLYFRNRHLFRRLNRNPYPEVTPGAPAGSSLAEIEKAREKARAERAERAERVGRTQGAARA